MMVDAVVFWDGPGFWHVNEQPSMRSLGEIARTGEDEYIIDPDSHSALSGISAGPYRSLDEALLAIGSHLEGRCTLKSPGRRF
jgi:hypothetical protein